LWGRSTANAKPTEVSEVNGGRRRASRVGDRGKICRSGKLDAAASARQRKEKTCLIERREDGTLKKVVDVVSDGKPAVQ
jgi:hypothetical protein